MSNTIMKLAVLLSNKSTGYSDSTNVIQAFFVIPSNKSADYEEKANMFGGNVKILDDALSDDGLSVKLNDGSTIAMDLFSHQLGYYRLDSNSKLRITSGHSTTDQNKLTSITEVGIPLALKRANTVVNLGRL